MVSTDLENKLKTRKDTEHERECCSDTTEHKEEFPYTHAYTHHKIISNIAPAMWCIWLWFGLVSYRSRSNSTCSFATQSGRGVVTLSSQASFRTV